MSGGRKSWTSEMDRVLCACWSMDNTLCEISILLGRTQYSVANRARSIGLRRSSEYLNRMISLQVSGDRNPNASWSSLDIQQLQDLYEIEGLTCAEIVPYMTHKSAIAIGVMTTKLKLRHTELQRTNARSRASMGARNGMFGKSSAWLGRHHTKHVKQMLALDAHIRWAGKTPQEQQDKVSQLKSGWRAWVAKNEGKPSKIEVQVAIWLAQMGVQATPQQVLGPYAVDFQIGNVVLECQGDYWHANPRKYADPTLWTFAQRKNVRRDRAKRTYLENRGYTLLYLWEWDIWKNPDVCKQKIAQIFGLSDVK